MSRVQSADGTSIAYTWAGNGPAVVLVGGGIDDGTENAPLGVALSSLGFSVVNYARRGRAASGFTPPYALEREIEDLAALLDLAGGSACLFGASSGGALALEACAAKLPVPRVAVYDVPYSVGSDAAARWQAYVVALDEALAREDRDGALALFMRLAGSSDEAIAGARESAYWPGLLALAPTLAHDAACLRDGRPPAAFGGVSQPVLVLTGGASEPGWLFGSAADALALLLPSATRSTLAGQGHVAAPDVLSRALADFFLPEPPPRG